MLGQSFGVFVDGPTQGPGPNWIPPGFPEIVHYFSVLEVETSAWSPCTWVGYWVTRCLFQPCPAICSTTNSIPWWTERATFECLMDRSIFLDHLDSFSTIFPKPSLAEHRAWSHPLGRWMCTMPKCSSTFSTMVWDPRDALFRTLLLSLPVGYGLKCQVPIPYHLLII